MKDKDEIDIFDMFGNKITTITNVKSFRNFQNGYMAVEFITKRYCDNNEPCEFKWGIVDTKGNIVVEPKYIYVGNATRYGSTYVKENQFDGKVIQMRK